MSTAPQPQILSRMEKKSSLHNLNEEKTSKPRMKKKMPSLPNKPISVPKDKSSKPGIPKSGGETNYKRSPQRNTSATSLASIKLKINSASSNRSYINSATSNRSYLSSARSNASTSTLKNRKGPVSRLDDFAEYEEDSGGEEEEGGQDVRFINVESDSAGTTAKSHAEPKKFTTITEQGVLDLAQESEHAHVYEIELSGKNIAVIENLDKFQRVRVLDLSCNYIKLIDNLDKNQDVRELKLYDNCISCVKNLEKLKDLSTLQLQHNQIGTLGKGFTPLRNLKVLRLDNNQLTKLDIREMAPLGKLSSLDISSNRLDNITAVSCLSSLEEFYCRNNRLRSIPDLSQCRKLQEVDFSYNQLANLSGLKSLPHLTVVNVSHNQLTTLRSLGKLKGLEELFVSHNRLTEVGCVVDFYPALQILDISDNHIEHWNHMCSLAGFHDLVELFVAGNPFSSEEGEKTHYIYDLQKLLPQIQVLDGAMLKKFSSRTGTPLMRPMTASSVVSSRQVETQMNHMKQEMTSFEETLSKRFDSLRDVLSTLPDRPPTLSHASSPDTSRPGSKCSKRSRIFQARQFALNHFEAVELQDSDSDDL